jgi:hypothetical protein
MSLCLCNLTVDLFVFASIFFSHVCTEKMNGCDNSVHDECCDVDKNLPITSLPGAHVTILRNLVDPPLTKRSRFRGVFYQSGDFYLANPLIQLLTIQRKLFKCPIPL